MQIIDGQLIYSATDLVGFIECTHLANLNRAVAERKLEPPHEKDPVLDRIAQRGYEHEQRFLAGLQHESGGLTVVEISEDPDRERPILERLRRGREATLDAMRSGADVIYHAAGGTGIGVLQAAADAGVLGIGVDSNQDYLHPGNMLTSMLKRVDNAVYDAMMDVQNGDWSTGVEVMGLAQDGVGYSVDEFNEALITEEMLTTTDQARTEIISGEIEVHDYMSDDSCPAS